MKVITCLLVITFENPIDFARTYATPDTKRDLLNSFSVFYHIVM